jgi:hypothetical protein
MSEVRWGSFGEITTKNVFTFLYSGYNANEGTVNQPIMVGLTAFFFY